MSVIKNTLQDVLDRAHRGHGYITDEDKHGVPEDWRIELAGDCDSFAMWCRQELRLLGIESTLVFCGVNNPLGDHLVCATMDGWVLDNRHKWVTSRDDLNYYWISLLKDGEWHSTNM